ncbi:dual CXXC motif small (seleno)protein [Maridesulfovibrio zosterae]|uniref:dual CXXC motif small (seleno)protein n=1 Tax=Maridesulfovibrio zosterae TaxID=82171 RepID=UPI0004295A34|nr:dual CXXC motif small (seleno)protein [Maridesulfovibrio zosterae]
MFQGRKTFNESTFEDATGESWCSCKSCGGDLYTRRSCTNVLLQCGACGKQFDVAEYSEFIDDDFEEEMSNVPMNRL